MSSNKIEKAIRADGAEIYIQAVLMVQRGIIASLASRNMPGYDVLATNLDSGEHCRIQVKYRQAANSNGMQIKNFDCDFVAYVAGNLGRIGKREPNAIAGPPEVFLIPVETVKEGTRSSGLYPNPTRGGHDAYREAWHLIDAFLDIPRPLLREDEE